jgi:6-pyruvoyltetrahydropterin/6-carboxytetrahydropterin synthase
MLRLGRRYRFSASHRLHSPDLNAEQNASIFGKCNNPYGHGHDYVLEVVLRGRRDEQTGLLIELDRLDRFVHESVLRIYDHKYMNEEIDSFERIPPTTENVAIDIRARLAAGWPFGERVTLDAVRIFETRRNVVELN